MEKKYVTAIMAMSLIVLMGVGMVSAFGFQNKMSEEDKEALKNAIESNDFEAWASIKRAQISEEKFNERVQRHQQREEFRNLIQEARENGDFERIEELKSEYGVGKQFNKRNMNQRDCPFR